MSSARGEAAPAAPRARQSLLHRHPGLQILAKLVRIPQALFGVVVLGVIVLAAVSAPWIVPVDPEEMDFENLLSGFSAEHWLGSDQMGRDTLARLIVGAQVALMVSLGAVGLGVLIGCPLGLAAVHFRGIVDDVIMRVMDALVVFPSLLIAVGLAAAMGGSLRSVILAIGIANIPWMARVVRSQGLSVRELDFVAAAQASGLGHGRIIFHHILPNTISIIITFIPFAISGGIVSLTALDYLGYGLPAPTPSWGELIQQGTTYLSHKWIITSVISAMIVVLVMVTFIGEAVREAFDPKLYTTYE